jgi:putative oxidoreductase
VNTRLSDLYLVARIWPALDTTHSVFAIQSRGGKFMKAPFLIGRIMLGGFFIYNGINHLKQRKTLAQYAAAKKVPRPDLAVTASGIMLIAGGTSIVLGIKPKLGALLAAGFLGVVSPAIHAFWKDQDPNERMNNMVNFSKNLALLGATVALAGVDEPWEASVPVAQPSRLERVRRVVRKSIAA